MNILGMGTVFSGGRGIDRFEAALAGGLSNTSQSIFNNRTLTAHKADMGEITDGSLKKIRRADKLSKMAVLAASEALLSSGIPVSSMSRPGVILATALGAHVTTFEFLDDILKFGDAAVSPTTFSNSVHNAPASYVSSVLGIHGPTMTVTDFAFPFHQAMQLAKLWIEQERCDYVMVGTTEQYGEVLGYVCEQKLGPSDSAGIAPFDFSKTHCVPGEGAFFFLLGPSSASGAIARVDNISFGANTDNPDLLIIDSDGMNKDESCYLDATKKHSRVAAYSPLFGSMMTGSSFNFGAAALMLKHQSYYANPVTHNPQRINLLSSAGPASIESIQCMKCDCDSFMATVMLRRA